MNLQRLNALAERGRRLSATTRPYRGEQWTPGGYSISASANGRTKVMLYGFIGDSWWDDESISAAKFVREIDQIDSGGIDLHINSRGGSVFDAVAMHAALLNHESEVVAYVDGVAASAASFLAMAGNEIVIEKPAKMMIHNAQGLMLGEKKDMREFADLLDELDATIAQIYADRSGKPASSFAAAMDKETWYSAQQAVDAGLADRVANDKKQDDKRDVNNVRSQLIRARARVTLRGGK